MTNKSNVSLETPFKGIEGIKIPMGAAEFILVNVRRKEMLGALIRVAAYTSQAKKPVTRDNILDICQTMIPAARVRRLRSN